MDLIFLLNIQKHVFKTFFWFRNVKIRKRFIPETQLLHVEGFLDGKNPKCNLSGLDANPKPLRLWETWLCQGPVCGYLPTNKYLIFI